MRLADFFKEGHILDNQTYRTTDGVIKNHRFSDEIALTKSPSNLWNKLLDVTGEINNLLSQNIQDFIVLFNSEEYEHNSSDQFVTVNGADSLNFSLSTGNLIGFVKRDNFSLKISSRFGDEFLKFIIADADGFLEVNNMGGEKQSEGYEWLLAYLWTIKLKRAYRLGLPKLYLTQTESTSKVRGSIDVLDFYLNRDRGIYRCRYREHSYESTAALLITRAFEYVETYSFVQKNRPIYQNFLSASQGIKRTHKELLDTPHFSNPYFHDYNELIDLSKQILNRKSTSFDEISQSSAFLFDVSMLFEYFIRKLLIRNSFRLFAKFEELHTITTGRERFKRKLQPDIVFEVNKELYVFDVKYKTFDSIYGVSRDDLFQLHTYIGQYGNNHKVKGCGFIYPASESKWRSLELDDMGGIIESEIVQHGVSIPFYVLFLKIPDETNTYFNASMIDECDAFIDTVNNRILNHSENVPWQPQNI